MAIKNYPNKIKGRPRKLKFEFIKEEKLFGSVALIKKSLFEA